MKKMRFLLSLTLVLSLAVFTSSWAAVNGPEDPAVDLVNNDFAGREILPAGEVSVVGYDIEGSISPDTYMGAFDENWILIPGATNDDIVPGNTASALTGIVVNVADKSINLMVTGYPDDDDDFDGMNSFVHDPTLGPHEQKGWFEVDVVIYDSADPATILDTFTFGPAQLTPGNVVPLSGITEAVGADLRFDATVNNQLDDIVGDDPIDYFEFNGLVAGAPFTAAVSLGDLSAVLTWFDENGGVLLSDTGDITVPSWPSVGGGIGDVVPADGRIILGVTGVPTAGYGPFDGHHRESTIGILPYDLDVTVDTSGGSVRTLALNVNGGNGTLAAEGGNDHDYYDDGVTPIVVNLTATPSAHYKVESWTGTDNDALLTNNNTVTMDMNQAVTVEFEKIQALLITGVSGSEKHGTLSPATGMVYAGTVVTLVATPEEGYVVDFWANTDNDNLKSNENTITIANSDDYDSGIPVTVSVEFKKDVDRYQLNTSVVGSGTLTPASGIQVASTQVALVATPAEGWRVKSWTGTNNDESVAEDNAVTMTSAKSVVVEFEQIPPSYQLAVSVAGGEGSVNPTGGTFESGTEVALTATPATGWRVKAWSGTDNDASTANTNVVTIDESNTVTVEFEAIPASYTLTASVAAGEGTIAPTSGSYEDGTIVTLTATPASGWRVKVWSGTNDDASVAETNAVTMNAAKTVSVEFEEINPSPVVTKYALNLSVASGEGTVSADPAGEVSGDDVVYDPNTVITFTAVPTEGWQVDVWVGATAGAGNTATLTMPAAEATVTVSFVRIPDASMAVDAMKIKVDKDRMDHQDSLEFEGVFGATSAQLLAADSIIVRIYADDELLFASAEIAVSADNYNNSKNAYSYDNKVGKDDPGAVSEIDFDFEDGEFSVEIDNADLTGFVAPITVEIEFGEYYGYDDVSAAEINKGKELPIGLLMGAEDTLAVSKFKTYEDGDKFSASGTITVADFPVDLTDEAVTVTWAGTAFELAVGDFAQSGSKPKYKASVETANGDISITIDLYKGTFKLKVKNAEGLATTGTLEISFGSFTESVDL